MPKGISVFVFEGEGKEDWRSELAVRVWRRNGVEWKDNYLWEK